MLGYLRAAPATPLIASDGTEAIASTRGVAGSCRLSDALCESERVWPSARAVAAVRNAPDEYVDDGIIRCSSFEQTDTGRAHVRNSCYTGVIDIHSGAEVLRSPPAWRGHSNKGQRGSTRALGTDLGRRPGRNLSENRSHSSAC